MNRKSCAYYFGSLYIYPSRLEVSVSSQAGFVAWVGAQAGFATVLAAWVGAQAGFATVLATWVGAQAGFGLGRCPGLGLGLVLVLAVAVGWRKHNFTQLNRIKIHNFNYNRCEAP